MNSRVIGGKYQNFQNMSLRTSESQDRHLVKLKVENTLDLTHILDGLQITTQHEKKHGLWVLVEFSERGIRFSLDDPSKTFQAVANVKKEIMQDYVRQNIL